MLCTEVTCPTAVRQLFHSSTVERANQGCLLEQARPLRRDPGKTSGQDEASQHDKRDVANDETSCAVVQVATHVISGLADAVSAVQRRSQQLFTPANGLRNPAMAARAATSTASEGIGKLLEAINVASSIIKVRTS